MLDNVTIFNVKTTLENGLINIWSNGSATNTCDFYFYGGYNTYVDIADIGLVAGNYTLSGAIGGSGSTYMLYIVQNRSGTLSYYTCFTAQGTNISLQEGDKLRIFIRVMSGTTMNNVKIYAQLEEGNQATSPEPHGVGNWYIEKNIGKVVLNGSESGWTGGSVATNVYRFYKTIEGIRAYTDSNRHIDRFITDRFKLSTSNEYGASYQYQNSLYFCVSSNEATTVDSFKTWLSNNNTTVYYQLATPTYEVIINENLIEQLNNIQDIGLIENLCYVDWVGKEKPTMTLQYNYEDTYQYNLGVQDFNLIAGKNYTLAAGGLDLELLNNNTKIYTGSGTYIPAADTTIDDTNLILKRGKQYENFNIYPSVSISASLKTTDFDFHFVDNSGLVADAYKCIETVSQNGIIARYQYSFTADSRFRSYIDGNIFTYSQLNSRRITAIGFAANWIGGGQYTSNREVLAVLDTSKYTLTINKSIPMNITRVDEITSDAQFYGLDFPVHLSPKGLESIKAYREWETGYAFDRQRTC